MKTAIMLIIAIMGSFFLCAWTTNQVNEINKTEWLIGTWENKKSKGSIYETWHRTKNSELAGKSYMLKNSDTVVFENIRLVQEQAGLFYIPTVKNQNDGRPVRFIAKKVSATQLVFENPQHDFPQVISYSKINRDFLVAEISGTINGQERKQMFPMKRVK